MGSVRFLSLGCIVLLLAACGGGGGGGGPRTVGNFTISTSSVTFDGEGPSQVLSLNRSGTLIAAGGEVFDPDFTLYGATAPPDAGTFSRLSPAGDRRAIRSVFAGHFAERRARVHHLRGHLLRRRALKSAGTGSAGQALSGHDPQTRSGRIPPV
jgi:hypothetical protein